MTVQGFDTGDETAEVIVIDDEAEIRASVSRWLELDGVHTRDFEGAESALAALPEDYPGVILSDVRMPGMSGLDLLQEIRRRDPALPVILVTGHGDVGMAVEAMRAGAYDFIEKPFDPERLLALIRRAARTRLLALENRLLRRQVVDGAGLARMLIGRSPAIEKLREEILDYAGTDASVMVLGETGAGKELVARALHEHSPRAGKPFVAVNCAAIPETLIEAELFGHEAGAYTGATRARPGHFEAAEGGTLFLDEVTTLPVHLQATLLRALQEREVTRIGARKPVKVDIRVISATNEDVAEAVAEGRFRQDLLYRLNAITLCAPPLRERGTDIVMLFEMFAERFAEEHHLPAPNLGPTDAALLMTHRWPGNVRQLINLAERAVLRSRRGPVDLSTLLSETEGAAPSAAAGSGIGNRSLKAQTDAFERMIIDAALRRHRGAIQPVLDELDLPRRTLNEKMARFGLNRSDYL